MQPDIAGTQLLLVLAAGPPLAAGRARRRAAEGPYATGSGIQAQEPFESSAADFPGGWRGPVWGGLGYWHHHQHASSSPGPSRSRLGCQWAPHSLQPAAQRRERPESDPRRAACGTCCGLPRALIPRAGGFPRAAAGAGSAASFALELARKSQLGLLITIFPLIEQPTCRWRLADCPAAHPGLAPCIMTSGPSRRRAA